MRELKTSYLDTLTFRAANANQRGSGLRLGARNYNTRHLDQGIGVLRSQSANRLCVLIAAQDDLEVRYGCLREQIAVLSGERHLQRILCTQLKETHKIIGSRLVDENGWVRQLVTAIEA